MASSITGGQVKAQVIEEARPVLFERLCVAENRIAALEHRLGETEMSISNIFPHINDMRVEMGLQPLDGDQIIPRTPPPVAGPIS